MRVAYMGDVHMNLKWTQAAIEYCAKRGSDVIVQLGDFGYVYPDPFVYGVLRALREHELEMVFVDGNHDNPAGYTNLNPNNDRYYPLLHAPRGTRWEWSGVTFLALGGAVSVDQKFRVPGVSWWPEETITADQAEAAMIGGPVDVMVSHDCPAGIEIPGLAESSHYFPEDAIRASDQHREILRSVVNVVQPRSFYFGHYHRRFDVTADLGYGPVEAHGLSMDGTSMDENILLVDLD